MWKRTPKAPHVARFGLTAEEQANVRAALRFIRVKLKMTSADIGKRIGVARCTVDRVLTDAKVDAIYAIHAARMAEVSVEDVLNGKYPPEGACPMCGRHG